MNIKKNIIPFTSGAILGALLFWGIIFFGLASLPGFEKTADEKLKKQYSECNFDLQITKALSKKEAKTYGEYADILIDEKRQLEQYNRLLVGELENYKTKYECLKKPN